MMLRAFVRCNGLWLILGGLIVVLSAFFSSSDQPASAALQPGWVLLWTVFTVGNLAVAFGLIGIEVRQAEQAGWLGLLGFMPAFASTVLAVAVTAIAASVYPAVAAWPGHPPLISDFATPTGPLPLVGSLTTVVVLLYKLGYVLTAIAVIRAGVLSRWAGWLLLVSTVVSLATLWPGSWVYIGLIALIAFGLALVWLGVDLVLDREAQPMLTQPTLSTKIGPK